MATKQSPKMVSQERLARVNGRGSIFSRSTAVGCVAVVASRSRSDAIVRGGSGRRNIGNFSINLAERTPQVSAQQVARNAVGTIAVGLVEGAKQAGMAIIGGETAIVPDLLSHDPGLDLVGMAAGICRKRDLILGDEIRKGDALVGIASSGMHSNGLTLAREILLRRHKLRENVPELGRSIGEELLEPTRIYVKPVLDATRKLEVHGLAHITGGAFAKLDRIVGQARLGADIDRLPSTPGIFRIIQKKGRISDREMYRTFNMGAGLVIVCPQRTEDAIIRLFTRHGHSAFDLGRVRKNSGIRVSGKIVN